MKKIEFCGMKGCEKWRVFGGTWSNKPFETAQDERLGWRVTTCPDHTEVSMIGEFYDEDGQNEDVRPPIVVYCLEDGCDLTAWYGAECWEISKDRAEGLETGRYTSMMKPYCPKHEAEKKANARKAS